MTPHLTSAPIAIVGPTASGKSAVAMALAERLGDAELVSVDSMQVYRGMDIGTAKPSPDERARVRHHLLDLVEPTATFTVAEFQRAAGAAVADIESRSQRAIYVGGTGLYHRAVIDDLDLPGEWPEIRAALHAEADDVGAPALHARLAAIDPAAAARIEPGNARRVVRALEVWQGSGRRFSSFGPGLDVYPDTPVVQIGLRWDRETLAQRVEQRVQRMVSEGFLAEVASLAERGFSHTAAQALGYRELLAHLRGETSFDEAVEMTTVRTRQFAVRQLRWFQRDPRVIWIDVAAEPVAEVIARLFDGCTNLRWGSA